MWQIWKQLERIKQQLEKVVLLLQHIAVMTLCSLVTSLRFYIIILCKQAHKSMILQSFWYILFADVGISGCNYDWHLDGKLSWWVCMAWQSCHRVQLSSAVYDSRTCVSLWKWSVAYLCLGVFFLNIVLNIYRMFLILFPALD